MLFKKCEIVVLLTAHLPGTADVIVVWNIYFKEKPVNLATI